jgi:hypothetical protein
MITVGCGIVLENFQEEMLCFPVSPLSGLPSWPKPNGQATIVTSGRRYRMGGDRQEAFPALPPGLEGSKYKSDDGRYIVETDLQLQKRKNLVR